MFTLFATAADDSALARITLTGTTSGGSCQLILIENADYSAAYDNGFDAPCNINLPEALPKTLYMYSYIGANKYSTIATNNLDGLEFGFISNLLDDEYTMTFEVFTLAPGRTLTVYDLTTSDTKEINPANSYTFNAAPGHNEYMRFVINYVAPSYAAEVTTNAYGLATFSFNQNLVAAEAGVKLYKGKVNGEYLDLNEVDYVKAGQGVIVYNEAGTATTYHFNAGIGTSDFSDNELLAATDWTGQGYVLSGSSLYTYTGVDFPANKAFLAMPSSGPAPKRISFRFNQPTAVENAKAAEVKAEKFVENGQIFIRRGNEVFNLQGQIVK